MQLLLSSVKGKGERLTRGEEGVHEAGVRAGRASSPCRLPWGGYSLAPDTIAGDAAVQPGERSAGGRVRQNGRPNKISGLRLRVKLRTTPRSGASSASAVREPRNALRLLGELRESGGTLLALSDAEIAEDLADQTAVLVVTGGRVDCRYSDSQ